MVVSVNEMLPLHRFEVVVTSVEDVNDSASLSFSYDLIGKLFEDAIVTLCVGIRKSTLGSVLTKSKVIPMVRTGSVLEQEFPRVSGHGPFGILPRKRYICIIHF